MTSMFFYKAQAWKPPAVGIICFMTEKNIYIIAKKGIAKYEKRSKIYLTIYV